MSGQSVVDATSGGGIQLILPGGLGLQAATNGGTTWFHHKDWLGSSRLVSSRANRTNNFDTAFAPFGENYASFGTTALNFTGDLQDVYAGIYDTPNREYYPNQGRWLSPDPAGAGAADSTNPQTWNRYAYVANNPLAFTDPSGLFGDLCAGTWDWGQGGFECGSHVVPRSYWEVQWTGVEMQGINSILPGENSTNWPVPYPVAQIIQDVLAGSWDRVFGIRVPGYNAPPIFDADAANNGSADPTLDARANALAQAINKTGVQAMANPCTYVAWTAAAATAGAGGVAVAHASEITAAAAENAPTITSRILQWWFNLTSRPGKPGLVRAAAATAVAAKDAAVSTCNQF